MTSNVGMHTVSAQTQTIIIKREYESLLPKLSPGEFESLKQSINEIGLQVPIIINQDNVLLDGHHRYRACLELEFAQLPISTLQFDDALDERKFVIKLNLDRRHLTKFQRIELEYKLETIESQLAQKRMSDAGRKGASERWTRNDKSNSHHDCSVKENGAVQNYTTLREINHLHKEAKPPTRGRVIDLSARNAHVSPMTYYKGREIIKSAPEEIKEKLRNDKLKIDKVYRQLQRQRLKEEMIRSSKESNIELSSNNTKVVLGDFVKKCAEGFIPGNSVDLILTDPPYGKDSLPMYKELAKIASQTLKAGGSLVAYAGNHLLPDIIELMSNEKELIYQRILAVKLSGQFARSYQQGVTIKWKPLLWYIKGSKRNTLDFIPDLIESKAPEKIVHEWEQSTIESEHVISRLTVENQIVFDPMMGSGTTGLSALKLNRKFLGIEIDEEKFEIAKRRIDNSFGKGKEVG